MRKPDVSAQLAGDVQRFLDRGGCITPCPAGVEAHPDIAMYIELVHDETDVRRARTRLDAARRRGTLASNRTKRGWR